jgi:hypothetical protein
LGMGVSGRPIQLTGSSSSSTRTDGVNVRWSADNPARGAGQRGAGPPWGHRAGGSSVIYAQGCVRGVARLCGGSLPQQVIGHHSGLPDANACSSGIATKRADGKWDYHAVAFHAFRKACGSMLLLRAGKDPRQVQQWLGHSQLTTTMNVYVHELDDGLGGADELDAILGGHHPGATEHPQTAANPEGPGEPNPAL